MDNPSYSAPTEEIKAALQNNDPAAAAKKIQAYLEEQKNIPLNIAITGESGSGKSTFVNAFRGVKNKDKGAAPTGCVETTFEVKAYPHPKYPNVTLWDLPGIGTTNFPADKYLEYVGFEKFDFFIIISDTRFRENDVKLSKEIQKMQKKFYFVRSKIDHSMRDEEESQEEDFNAEKTLKLIRENCMKGLQGQGVESPKVFLVSSRKLHLYDFHLLQETLDRELPEHKRNAVLLAMPNINLEIIKKKKEAFKAKIQYHALIAALVATIPVPGLSFLVDLTTLQKPVMEYITGFGLDSDSLQKLAGSAAAGIIVSSLLFLFQFPVFCLLKTTEIDMDNPSYSAPTEEIKAALQNNDPAAAAEMINAMRDEEESQEEDFNAEKTLKLIRENCMKGLQDQGVESPKVFLVSSRKLHLYDFHLLQETLERELPVHKRDALLFAMPNINLEIIKKKKEAFGAKIKWYAAGSACVASVPVPGLSFVVDISLLVKTIKEYQIGFGLDSSSLQKLAESAHVPLSDLKAVMKSPLGATQITNDVLINALRLSTFQTALFTAEEVSHFIPLLGIPLGMAFSFTSTYNALDMFLNMLAEDAQNVFRKALGLNTPV
ncbi:hypothetical protein LDENG_00047590 [Lucifuga dentata]|nr:hypothetical protein LDENG_00047590 [Lucifuga dentata]